jgi:hypothetical protein
MPAISRQDAAQRRQASSQAFICVSPPSWAQLVAHRSHTSAHTRQV